MWDVYHLYLPPMPRESAIIHKNSTVVCDYWILYYTSDFLMKGASDNITIFFVFLSIVAKVQWKTWTISPSGLHFNTWVCVKISDVEMFWPVRMLLPGQCSPVLIQQQLLVVCTWSHLVHQHLLLSSAVTAHQTVLRIVWYFALGILKELSKIKAMFTISSWLERRMCYLSWFIPLIG